MTNLCYIAKQPNMLMARGGHNTLSLYDTSMTADRNDGIEYFEPLLQMEGHPTEVSKGTNFRVSEWTGTMKTKL